MSKHAEEYELLELAAMAAGVKFDATRSMPPVDNKFFGLWLAIDGEPNEYTRRRWNPLTDDGDALRMAVNLGINVMPDSWIGNPSGYGLARASRPCGFYNSEPHNGDPLAATRRAITRAAAEIGKAMP